MSHLFWVNLSYLRSFEAVWGRLRPFEAVRGRSRLFEAVWGRSRPFKAIWSHSRPFEAVRGRSRLFEVIRGRSRPFEAIRGLFKTIWIFNAKWDFFEISKHCYRPVISWRKSRLNRDMEKKMRSCQNSWITDFTQLYSHHDFLKVVWLSLLPTIFTYEPFMAIIAYNNVCSSMRFPDFCQFMNKSWIPFLQQ